MSAGAGHETATRNRGLRAATRAVARIQSGDRHPVKSCHVCSSSGALAADPDSFGAIGANTMIVGRFAGVFAHASLRWECSRCACQLPGRLRGLALQRGRARSRSLASANIARTRVRSLQRIRCKEWRSPAGRPPIAAGKKAGGVTVGRRRQPGGCISRICCRSPGLSHNRENGARPAAAPYCPSAE